MEVMMKQRNATKIKISIRYHDSKGTPRKIRIPKLRFSRAASLMRFALKVSRKETNLSLEDIYGAIDYFEEVLSSLPPFELIHVEAPEDNTYIDIYTCR